MSSKRLVKGLPLFAYALRLQVEKSSASPPFHNLLFQYSRQRRFLKQEVQEGAPGRVSSISQPKILESNNVTR